MEKGVISLGILRLLQQGFRNEVTPFPVKGCLQWKTLRGETCLPVGRAVTSLLNQAKIRCSLPSISSTGYLPGSKVKRDSPSFEAKSAGSS